MDLRVLRTLKVLLICKISFYHFFTPHPHLSFVPFDSVRNLQAAVGAFYDHYSTDTGVLPGVTLVGRRGQGGQPTPASLNLMPNTKFTETWTLKNTGKQDQLCVLLYSNC